MSFDLGVWDKKIGESPDIYVRLCDGQLTPDGESPQVSAFYNELTNRWPEIDTVPDEKIGDFEFCPWSCAIDRSGMHVLVACVWPKADEVAAFVEKLAAKHDLVLYDPQKDEVKVPGSTKKPFGRWFTS
jgi:hypothetical protein